MDRISLKRGESGTVATNGKIPKFAEFDERWESLNRLCQDEKVKQETEDQSSEEEILSDYEVGIVQDLYNEPVFKAIPGIKTYNEEDFTVYRPKARIKKKTIRYELPMQSIEQSMEKSLYVSTSQFIHKYKPQNIDQLIGNTSQLNKLKKWLNEWTRTKIPLAALISGPPGIGKTTAARLISKLLSYSLVELNASDARNKSIVSDKVKPFCLNTAIIDPLSVTKGLLIMDEVDGMSSGDEGGILALIEIIKITKIPIICICNDRFGPKLRALAPHCLDVRMGKPLPCDVLKFLLKMNQIERLGLPRGKLEEIVAHARGDIRQTCLLLETCLLQPNREINANSKDVSVSLSPFEAVSRLVNKKNCEYDEKMSIVMTDYDLIPLLLHENYPNWSDEIPVISEVADYIALGDVSINRIKSSQEWELLPDYVLLSAIAPSHLLVNSSERVEFTSLLGKISTQNKNFKLYTEIKTMLMHSGTACPKESVSEIASCILMQLSSMISNKEFTELQKYCDRYRLNWTTIKDTLITFSNRKSKEEFSSVSTACKRKAAKTLKS